MAKSRWLISRVLFLDYLGLSVVIPVPVMYGSVSLSDQWDQFGINKKNSNKKVKQIFFKQTQNEWTWIWRQICDISVLQKWPPETLIFNTWIFSTLRIDWNPWRNSTKNPGETRKKTTNWNPLPFLGVQHLRVGVECHLPLPQGRGPIICPFRRLRGGKEELEELEERHDSVDVYVEIVGEFTVSCVFFLNFHLLFLECLKSMVCLCDFL